MGFLIKECRKHAGMTQQQAADAVGVKKRTYASWERGEAMISLEQACVLCEAFNCTVGQLSGFDELSKAKSESSIIDISGLDNDELDQVQQFVNFIVSKRGQ